MKLKDRFGHEVPGWLRRLGVWRITMDCVEASWGWFSPKPAFELRYGYTYNEARPCIDFGLIWGKWSINIPFAKAPGFDFEKFEHSYGFHWFGTGVHFNWGKKFWIWDLPFRSWEFVSHEVRDKDGNWNPHVLTFHGDDGRYIETHPYSYTLNSGKVQERQATIYAERWTHHRKWAPFLKRVSKSIHVEFDDEVGERTGSWKGGTIGCSYDMLPGETMLGALRRMESERKFR